MPKFPKNHEKQKLQELLRKLRLDAGFNQEELAKRLGRPQSFVSKYEMGERRIDILELRQICQVLEMNINEFITRFENELNESESIIS
jgi:transcriptional regulator with XRE-family HTH domain